MTEEFTVSGFRTEARNCDDDACGCGCRAHARDHDDHDHDHGHAHAHGESEGPWWQTANGRLTVAVGISMAIAYALSWFAPAVASYAFAAVVVGGLAPIARRAFVGALAGAPLSIETLLVIAAVGALFLGAGEEASMVVFLFLVGELLEDYAAAKARGSIRALTSLMPETALVETGDGVVEERPAAELAVGDRVRIRPGDRVPCDGTIVDGLSELDQSMMTGESLPVRRGPGDAVLAGTINGAGVLSVAVTAPARETALARIVHLVAEAQESKAPVERFINRFARYYTPAVALVGAAVAVLPPLLVGAPWSEWIYRGLAMLLIGCPCAFVISTPAAMAAALSFGARHGLLIKGGAVLERLAAITAVAFDKTGTLTLGRPTVSDVVAAEAGSEADVLRLAAALETAQSHPLALAIVARAEANGLTIPPADGVAARPGRGVAGTVEGRACFLGSVEAAGGEAALPERLFSAIAEIGAKGRTVAVLTADGAAIGLIGLGDAVRPDAAEGIAELRKRGISAVMLTGDNERAAAAVGSALDIDVRAGLLPEDKARIVAEIRQKGAVVAKVGDGINDAPALAVADVGIAIGGGTDVALEAADAALLHARVGDVAAMVDLGRRALANVRQNVAIALGLKAVFLVTTVIGVTGLWPAILADTGATVLVTGNALRLLVWPKAK